MLIQMCTCHYERDKCYTILSNLDTSLAEVGITYLHTTSIPPLIYHTMAILLVLQIIVASGHLC